MQVDLVGCAIVLLLMVSSFILGEYHVIYRLDRATTDPSAPYYIPRVFVQEMQQILDSALNTLNNTSSMVTNMNTCLDSTLNNTAKINTD